MLKKIVKYGNSNALILDKAILELLEIAEGSVLKIRTDGKSLIITPHVDQVSEHRISKTLTAEDALDEAIVNEYLKKYAHLPQDKRELVAKEFSTLYKEHKKNLLTLAHNSDYIKEFENVRTQYHANFTSPEYTQAANALRYRYSPELQQIEKNLIEFETKHGVSTLIQQANQKLYEDVHYSFTQVFKKHDSVQQKIVGIMQNMEFQHKQQLLAEAFENNKDSAEYIKAIQELKYTYLPEAQEMDNAILAASTHVNQTALASKS